MLKALKEKYNKNLSRVAKAEKYFATHTVDESMKYVELYNEIARELSLLIIDIEKLLKRKMTKDEILNGFKEVKR